MQCLEYWNKSLMYIGKSRGPRMLPKITNFGGDVMLFLIDVKLYVKIIANQFCLNQQVLKI